MKKYIKILVGLFIIGICLIINKPSYAMSQEDAGQALADFSIDFYKHYADVCRYQVEGRENTYKGITTGGYYVFDCVGWVDFAIHQCLKIGGESMSYFAVPPGGGNTPYFRNGFELVIGDVYNANNLLDQEVVEDTLQPGDILFCGPGGPHVVIYVGDHNIIHCYSNLECEDLYANDMKYTGYCAIGRITKETAAGIDEDNVVTMYDGDGYDAEGRAYNGRTSGTRTGKYKGTKKISWLFENFLGFIDYLFGVLAYIIRAPFVGWANIVENMINDTVYEMSGVRIEESAPSVPEEEEEENVEVEPEVPDGKSEDIYIPTANLAYGNEHRINVEDLIYNRVPLLDVNIFDIDLSDTLSDKKITISENSIIYKLRENVARWYMAIRIFSIVSLLLVLIYLGIRLAISTTAGTKAKYKSMLMAWLTGFILVFFIHYFMIVVIGVNDIFVNMLKGAEVRYSGGLSMYDTIRTRAYSLKLSEGVPATVMYMVLIYYLIRFMYVYFKRYLAINILALLGPVAAVKYAYDKISKGKSNSMVSWMRDFALNVLLQSVHALLYTTLMVIAYEVGMESIPGFIISLVILNFVFKAEDIFLNIFKFDGKSLGDVRENKNYFAEAWGFTKGIGYFSAAVGKFGFGAVANTTKFVGNVGVGVAELATGGYEAVKNDAGEVEGYKPIDVREKMHDRLEEIKGKGMTALDDKLFQITGARSMRLGLYRMKKTDTDLYNATRTLIRENDKLTRQVFTRSISNSARTIANMVTFTASIPTMVVSPSSGFTMFTSTLQDIRRDSGRNKHYGYVPKKKRNIVRGVGNVSARLLTSGAIGTAIANIEKSESELKKISKNNASLEDLRRANRLEREIEEEVAKIERELEEQKKQKTTDEEREKLAEAERKAREDAIRQSLKAVLSSRNVRGLVKDYMRKNRLAVLTDADIDGLLRELNVDSLKGEIEHLTDSSQSEIDKLKADADKIRKELARAANQQNMDEEARKAVEAMQRELAKKEKRVDVKEAEKEVIAEIGEKIVVSGSIEDGYIQLKGKINETIREYKEKSGVKDLTAEDTDKVVALFGEKVESGEILKYGTSEEIKEQFREQDKDGKGVKIKGAVNAFLNASENASKDAIKVSPEYEVLASKIRELEMLNQRYINNNGKSAADVRELIKKIKK